MLCAHYLMTLDPLLIPKPGTSRNNLNPPEHLPESSRNKPKQTKSTQNTHHLIRLESGWFGLIRVDSAEKSRFGRKKHETAPNQATNFTKPGTTRIKPNHANQTEASESTGIKRMNPNQANQSEPTHIKRINTNQPKTRILAFSLD